MIPRRTDTGKRALAIHRVDQSGAGLRVGLRRVAPMPLLARSIHVLLAAGLCLAASTLPAAERALAPTPQTHSGPWYQPGAPVVDSLWQEGQAGQRLQLQGRVLNTRGEPVAGALVELWHTDANGSYPPLRASLETRRSGAFGIVTVLPGHNQGYRARHIHFVISHPGYRQLVTRIFFHGDRNIDEAPYPELAVDLESGEIDGEPVLYSDLLFVLEPR